MPKTFYLVMASIEFGGETFRYDSEEERMKSLEGILNEARKLNDGIERWFRFYEE